MLELLSRLNRHRLARRRAARQARDAAVVEAQPARAALERVLARFAPQQTGHPLIRIGPEGDGGYLLPNDLDGIGALYSPGVSDTTGFDLDIAQRDIPCYLADGSVDMPDDLPPRMTFEKIMIGDGPQGTFRSFAGWVDEHGPADGDLLLQMDIEGGEYPVLTATEPALLQRFRIIVLELHGLDRRLHGPGLAELEALLTRLDADHLLCHLHPNNCHAAVPVIGRAVPPVLELTYLRRDRVLPGAQGEAAYPHPLDRVNVPDRPDIPPVPFWR